MTIKISRQPYCNEYYTLKKTIPQRRLYHDEDHAGCCAAASQAGVYMQAQLFNSIPNRILSSLRKLLTPLVFLSSTTPFSSKDCQSHALSKLGFLSPEWWYLAELSHCIIQAWRGRFHLTLTASDKGLGYGIDQMALLLFMSTSRMLQDRQAGRCKWSPTSIPTARVK